MSDMGVGTWDATGKYNNYGIKPVSVVTIIHLTAGQTSGSYSFSNVPSGMKVGFALTLENGSSPTVGRRIEASGSTINIYPASSIGLGNYPSNDVDMIVFLESI